MSGPVSQRFGLAGLARATQNSLSLRNWVPALKRERAASAAESRQAGEALNQLIEAEIIPRLMLSNRDSVAPLEPVGARPDESHAFCDADIDAFAKRAVVEDAEPLVNEIEALLRQGVPREQILLNFLAPVARRLGALWDTDERDFAEVTIGLMKLHRVLDSISTAGPTGVDAQRPVPRILLAPTPGEHHVFGLMMVAEFFGRSGWQVDCDLDLEPEPLLERVAETAFDVIGFSASTELGVETLRGLIERVRAASAAPDVTILVGGQVFNENRRLAQRVGADAFAEDAVRAVVTAERLVHSRTQLSSARY